jgi:hypothetical protein
MKVFAVIGIVLAVLMLVTHSVIIADTMTLARDLLGAAKS